MGFSCHFILLNTTVRNYTNRGDRKLMMDLRTFFRNLPGHESAEEVVRGALCFHCFVWKSEVVAMVRDNLNQQYNN